MAHRLPWLILVFAAAVVFFFVWDQGWLADLHLGRGSAPEDEFPEFEGAEILEAEIGDLGPRLAGAPGAHERVYGEGEGDGDGAASKGKQGVKTKGPGEVTFGGMVKDTAGRPAEKVHVVAMGPTDVYTADTSAAGRFQLALVPGRYKLLFRAEGLGGLALGSFMVDGATGVDGEFVLQQTVAFKATVLREGQGVEGANVALHLKTGIGGEARQTDVAGEAVFEELVQGSYWLVTTLPEGEEIRKGLELTKDQELALKVQPGVRIHGRIEDGETAAPIPEARVEIGVKGNAGTWILVDGVTGPDGIYELSVPKGQVARFGVTVDGYAPWPHKRKLRTVLKSLRNLAKGKEVERGAKLVRGLVLAGTVKNHEDEPIGGLELRIQGRGVPALEAKTGEEGTYTVTGIVPGRYDVVVLSEGWFSEKALRVNVRKLPMGETVTYDFKVHPALEVSGRVTHKKDKGAAGARVWITGGGRMLRAAHNAGRDLETFTDADGWWRITDLPPNLSIMVRASLGTLEARPRWLKTTAIPDAPLDLRLAATVTLEGEIVDLTSGQPVKGVSVELRPIGSPGGRTTRKLKSDDQGRFESYELIPGDWRITASHGSYLKLEPTMRKLSSGEDKASTRLYLDPGLAIGGFVSDENGTRLRGASVLVTGRSRGGAWKKRWATADTHGRFRLTGFERGTYTLLVRRGGYRNKRLKGLTGGEQALQLALKKR